MHNTVKCSPISLSSSRLQPERYRRLLGSTNRTNINLNTSCGPLSIDREPSPVQPLHSTAEDGSGSVDAGSESGGDRSDSDGEEVGEDGDSGGRDTEDLSTRSSAGVRYRGRRGAGENAGKSQKVFTLYKTCKYRQMSCMTVQ